MRKRYMIVLLLFACLALPAMVRSQIDTSRKKPAPLDTLRVEPDGTEGVLNAVRAEDTSVNKLPKNEFVGPVSTFKVGMGYIHDFTTYIQSDVFRQQMDSAKLDVTPAGKVRDFRV